MIRVFVQELALFVLPFLLFAIALRLQKKKVLDIAHWRGAAAWLTLAGLALVILSFLIIAMLGPKQTGAYVPPHMENGRPVQGGFK